MTTAIQSKSDRKKSTDRVVVKPSKVEPGTSKPFTLDQELEPFANWTSDPIWVPPKDSSDKMAETMLRQSGLFRSRQTSWDAMVEEHRDNFTQVREIDLCKTSIRLPKGKLYVSVLERNQFDRITDDVPDCVQARLDEFLAGPGRRKGVKVYYLKPLCVEVDDQLYFTSRRDLDSAIKRIQEEVFEHYRKLYLRRRPKQLTIAAINHTLAIPRAIVRQGMKRRQRAIDSYQAKLEFQRRKTALRAGQHAPQVSHSRMHV